MHQMLARGLENSLVHVPHSMTDSLARILVSTAEAVVWPLSTNGGKGPMR